MTKSKTKKGAASIYAVVFATLLLGIITVSFVRLILRESTDTTNSELASSSRDSALAGVEEAKRAIDSVITIGLVPGNSFDNCDFVNRQLYNDTGEVLVKEENGATSKTEQAYTCVTVNPKSADYRGKLDNSKAVVVVPLQREHKERINSIKFEWQTNEGGLPLAYPDQSDYKTSEEQSINGNTVPPVISFQYINVPDGSFEPVSTYDPGSASTSTAVLYLTPSGAATGTTDTMDKATFNQHHDGSHKNDPTYVRCNQNADYVCSFSLTGIDDDSTIQYLVVSLPYGEASTGAQTDFRVTMTTDGGANLDFWGVQYLVDSTGRANDLYTRVEVRLNTVDPDFPYPQFALQTNDRLEKYFWVTSVCKKIDDGKVDSCETSGNL